MEALPGPPARALTMTDPDQHVRDLERPHPNLYKYYCLLSLLFGPLFPFPLLYFTFRFRTLRYRFDDEGVTVRWGALFRREISLTFGRIQDIHLVSNLVERWLGLARVQIQTAAGSSTAEMTVEGFQEFEMIRDFLYSRMRGARKTPKKPAEAGEESLAPDREAVAALREAAREIRMLREELAAGRTVSSHEE